MGIKDLKKAQPEDEEVAKLQSCLEVWAGQFSGIEILNGISLTDVELVTGSPNVIAHKLGRELIGWMVTRKRATADIWDEQDANTFKSKSLVLETSADVTIDLWVF